MWEKIKSTLKWIGKQIKEYPDFVLVSTLILVLAACSVLFILDISSLSMGIMGAICIIGGPVCGGFLGWLTRRRLLSSQLSSDEQILQSILNSTSERKKLLPSSLYVEKKDIFASPARISKSFSYYAEQKTASSFFQSTHSVSQFLRHVVRGEQREAECMLLRASRKKETAGEANNCVPLLLITKGTAIDQAGQLFVDITAFKYALWAKDRHMWRMLLKYLPRAEAIKQLQEHENEDELTKPDYVKKYGKYFSFAELKNALEKYNRYMASYGTAEFDWAVAKRIWTQEVGLDGGAQSRLPAHVVNEYCHPNRPFYNARESFKTDHFLPRSFIFYNWLTYSDCSWFRDASRANLDPYPAHLYSVGIWRGAGETWGASVGLANNGVLRWSVDDSDLAAVIDLDEVRTAEIEALKVALCPAPDKVAALGGAFKI